MTKYQFFAAAWYKAIRPETFISGFRKVGVCPFDSTAITAPDIPMNEAGHDEAGDELPDESDEENNPSVECGLMEDAESHDVNMDDRATQATFTPKQLELFNARLDNGYVLLSEMYCLSQE